MASLIYTHLPSPLLQSQSFYSLLMMTTVIMVIQKKPPGHSELSTMASTTVTMNITTTMMILHTIRFVRLPPLERHKDINKQTISLAGPGRIPGSWIMMRHVSCILLLEWSTTSQRLWLYRISVPYAQKDPRFLFEKRRGQHWEFWSLVSTIDGSTLPQDCVEDLRCGTQRNW